MCRYVTGEILQELCDESSTVLDTSTSSSSGQTQHPPFQAQISELLVVVLESEDDSEGQLSGLTILQDLLSKYGIAFDEQFVRLGLPNKIAILAGPAEEEVKKEEEEEGQGEKDVAEGGEEVKGPDREEKEKEKEKSDAEDLPDGVVESSVDPQPSEDVEKKDKIEEEGGGEEKGTQAEMEDATELAIHTPYRWRDWSAVRSRDCLYLWNGFCSIELSTISNGWFRFLIDNKLATMYSSGSTEGGAGSFGESSTTPLDLRVHPPGRAKTTDVILGIEGKGGGGNSMKQVPPTPLITPLMYIRALGNFHFFPESLCFVEYHNCEVVITGFVAS